MSFAGLSLRANGVGSSQGPWAWQPGARRAREDRGPGPAVGQKGHPAFLPLALPRPSVDQGRPTPAGEAGCWTQCASSKAHLFPNTLRGHREVPSNQVFGPQHVSSYISAVIPKGLISTL